MKLLVTGASGFLGWHIAQQGCQHYDHVLALGGSQLPVELPCPIQRINLLNATATYQLLNGYQPDVIIHAAAAARPTDCNAKPEWSQQLNVGVSQQLANWCQTNNKKLVFCSTDLVFDGTQGQLNETAKPNPINLYGKQKLAAEQQVLAAGGCVCRLPLMYGQAINPDSESCLQGMLKTLQAGKPLTLFTDEIRSLANAEDVAKGLLLAAKHNQAIWHLGGPEALSRWEFGQLVAKQWGYAEELITPALAAEHSWAIDRPKDVSMSSQLARGLGYAPVMVVDALASIALA